MENGWVCFDHMPHPRHIHNVAVDCAMSVRPSEFISLGRLRGRNDNPKRRDSRPKLIATSPGAGNLLKLLVSSDVRLCGVEREPALFGENGAAHRLQSADESV